MIENLGEALGRLKETVANGAVPVLTREALDTVFHGLNVSQLAKLVDAPALAYADAGSDGRGQRIERILIDGGDPARKQALVRRLLLERESPAAAGEVQELVLLDAGKVAGTWVRDRSDVVYRVDDRHAEIDRDLTAVLAERKRAAVPLPPLAANEQDERAIGYARPLVIGDPVAFSGMVGELIQRAGAVHAQNRALFEALRRAFGAGAPAVEQGLEQLVAGARQLEADLEGLQHAAARLLSMLEAAPPLHPLADPHH